MQKMFAPVHLLYQGGFYFLVRELEKQLCMPDSEDCKPLQKTLTTTRSIKIAGQTLKAFMLLEIQKTYTKRFHDPNKTILVHSNPTYPIK